MIWPIAVVLVALGTCAVLLCAAGHLVRDGTPPLGNTQLARAVGGTLCTIGALILWPSWLGLGLGAAIWLGFYTDMLHAYGQQARGWMDAAALAMSGATTLLPLGVAGWYVTGQEIALSSILLTGLVAKPVIWFATNRLLPVSAVPTRWAATIFGAVVGGVLVALAVLG